MSTYGRRPLERIDVCSWTFKVANRLAYCSKSIVEFSKKVNSFKHLLSLAWTSSVGDGTFKMTTADVADFRTVVGVAGVGSETFCARRRYRRRRRSKRRLTMLESDENAVALRRCKNVSRISINNKPGFKQKRRATSKADKLKLTGQILGRVFHSGQEWAHVGHQIHWWQFNSQT